MPFSPVHRARKLSAVLGTTIIRLGADQPCEGWHFVPSLNCTTLVPSSQFHAHLLNTKITDQFKSDAASLAVTDLNVKEDAGALCEGVVSKPSISLQGRSDPALKR